MTQSKTRANIQHQLEACRFLASTIDRQFKVKESLYTLVTKYFPIQSNLITSITLNTDKMKKNTLITLQLIKYMSVSLVAVRVEYMPLLSYL